MSPVESEPVVRSWGFPRVSGDEPRFHHDCDCEIVFSPRERG